MHIKEIDSEEQEHALNEKNWLSCFSQRQNPRSKRCWANNLHLKHSYQMKAIRYIITSAKRNKMNIVINTLRI